jgi:multidrug transporter EmrE-like cation transporter
MAAESTPDTTLLCAPSADLEFKTGPLPRILSHWWIAFAASSLFVVSGHLLIKAGLNGSAPLPADTGPVVRALHSILHLTVLSGLSIYLIGTVCWMRAVSQKEISFLYPLSSINFVLIAAASMVLLHETISGQRIAGILLVVLGMVLMNTRSGEGRT